MTHVQVAEASRELGGFYVPRFRVEVDGAELPEDVLGDVIRLTYKDDVKTLDGFELTVNNWDAENLREKYVGEHVQASRERLFEPCDKEVKVYLGYGSQLTRMLTGHFVTLEPEFPASGAPTLAVRGLNVLHRLRTRQFSYAWTGRRESEIAADIATLTHRGRRRFPYDIRTGENFEDEETEIEYLAQDNQYDIDFLLALARRRGYTLYVVEDADQPTLYFGPSDTPAPEITYVLEWGKSLVDFRPTLTTANQVRSVTVRGWDRRRRRVISETRSLDQRRPCRNRDLQELLRSSCNAREEVVVDEPVFTPAQAGRRAERELCERNKDVVKATGTTVGLPDLRAGRHVRILGLGSRFSGTYFVTDTTHSIGDGGYTTRFSARREEEEGGT
jgi:phage protein D